MLILSVVISVYLCHINLSDQFKDTKYTLVSAGVFWITASLYSALMLPFSSIVRDLSLIITSSLILIGLLMIIRELKPEIFRYPYLAVFMPVVIPVSYYLIYQTSMIRVTIVHSVLVLIILVTLIISIGYRTNIKQLLAVISGGLLLGLSVIVSFFFDEQQYISLLWYLITGIGIILTSYGFLITFNRKIEVN